ncbi:MAG TPA: ABC transporter ATP-binding protein [Candidatus Limnocylindrales bacterium]|nr:ABC transporter ATP-binding protein [Candidatus Limnocylindrales bacterium]
MADVAVRLTQLTKRFGGDAAGRRVAQYVEGATPGDSVLAVDHIDLEVRDREFFSLLGPSGCGKTTTLRMIGGFEAPTSGRIELAGQDVTWLPPFRRNVNTVFQNYALFPHLTVFENVAFGLRRKKVASAELRQRVALARALVNRPAVLLLDEPLGALDLKLRKQMQVELKRIQQEVGITFIYVTHDQEEAMTMSDRIAVMNRGRYEQLGEPEVLYERPHTTFVAGFLGVSNLLTATPDGSAGAGGANGADHAAFRLADGTPVRVPRTTVDGHAGPVAIGVRPEKIRLSEPSASVAPSMNRLTGVIADASYLGVSTQYIVALSDGHRVTVYEQNVERATRAELWTSGEAVQLSWLPEHSFVVPDAGPVEAPSEEAA